MICFQCKNQNMKSRIIHESNHLSMICGKRWPQYYDEDGNWHTHDPNTETKRFVCTNGHVTYQKKYLSPLCHSYQICDWKPTTSLEILWIDKFLSRF